MFEVYDTGRVPLLVSILRRIEACLAVTSARLRSQPLRPGLLLSGTALAVALLVAVVGGSLVARQQALARALSALPASERGFRVDRFGLPLDQRTYEAVDRQPVVGEHEGADRLAQLHGTFALACEASSL